MTLNKRIREIRLSKKMNQIQLAEKLGVTVQSYSMKEAGKRPITTDELQIIANTLGVSIAELFK